MESFVNMIHSIWNVTFEVRWLCVCVRVWQAKCDVKKEIAIKNTVISNHVNVLTLCFRNRISSQIKTQKWLTSAELNSPHFNSIHFCTTKLWEWMLFNWRRYVFKMNHNLTFKFESRWLLVYVQYAHRAHIWPSLVVLFFVSSFLFFACKLSVHITREFSFLVFTHDQNGHETNEEKWELKAELNTQTRHHRLYHQMNTPQYASLTTVYWSRATSQLLQ